MAAIHQFVAGFANGDAISNEALLLRRLFRSWGLTSDIFCEPKRILPELRSEAADFRDCAPAAGDTALLHLSIGSPVNERFRDLPCRKAVLYHNVTPPEHFAWVNPQTARDLARGREQVRALAGVPDLTLADSRFNAAELEALGYRQPRVLPLVLDLDRLAAAPDRRILRRCRDGAANVLFVGRGAPNKKIEDALAAFACFRRGVEPNARFIHVGSFAGTERYHGLLLARCRELGLDRVVFAGNVPQAELNAYYRGARLFLCMSEHEGFCIPLVESMVHDVPVLAYAAAAVPETLEGAGVLFHAKEAEQVAEMMGRLAADGPLRTAVLEGQQRRLARYRSRDLAAELRGLLQPLLGGA